MHTRKRLFLLTLAVAMFLPSGCHKFSVVAPALPPALGHSRYTPDNYTSDSAQYNNAMAKNPIDKDAGKIWRDKIAYGLMAEIDNSYGQFTKNLFTGKGDIGVAGDSTQLGLTAAAAIATHVPTKTILSALATAFTGVNLSVDKNFFAQQTYQTIAVAMQTRRDKARDALVKSLDDEVTDYPLEAVKRDLVSYFYAGTLPGGLQELQEEAGEAAAKSASAQPKAVLH
jgi:hypothetical protein